MYLIISYSKPVFWLSSYPKKPSILLFHFAFLLACLTVPVFWELSGRNIDAIPLDIAARLLDNTDVNGWLILKHTLHEISIRLWLERKVEHTLVPSLDRPSHTLAQVIDGSPISRSIPSPNTGGDTIESRIWTGLLPMGRTTCPTCR